MTAIEIINEWNAKTAEQQYSFCQNCVKRAIKQGRKLKAGYDMEDVTQETFAVVLKRLADPATLDADTAQRESQGKATNTLNAVVCRAANSTMERIAYHAAKDSKATSRTTITEDGDEIDALNLIAGTADTERSAIIRATLRDFIAGQDATNQIIFKGKMCGLSEREISEHVDISNVAVHNRYAKMLRALAEMLI